MKITQKQALVFAQIARSKGLSQRQAKAIVQVIGTVAAIEVFCSSEAGWTPQREQPMHRKYGMHKLHRYWTK